MSRQQQKLFGGKADAPEPRKKKQTRLFNDYRQNKPLIDPETLDKTPSEEYLERIRNEMYVWDMRCWDERSREEAAKWVKSLKEGGNDWKNCGHATWCIQKLLRRGVDESTIVDAIMDNDQIQYRNRLVKCFGGGGVELENDFSNHPCPRAREARGYSEAHCEDCEDPKDVARNYGPRRKRKQMESIEILGEDTVDEDDEDEGLAEEASGTGAGKQQQKAA